MNSRSYHTRGRDMLLRYLQLHRDEAQRADDIYAALSANEGAPAKSSVYRMLSALCREGAVKRFRAGHGEEGFVYQFVDNAAHCGEHFHLQCTACGQLVHLKCDFGNTLRAHLLADHGFTVDSAASILYGKCNACQRKEHNA